MKPHKHAELIKAWADGAEIEYKNVQHGWVACSPEGMFWDVSGEYRIKPEIKKDPLKIISELIHYPQCWDDVTYPTLEDAVIEVCKDFNCTNEDTHKIKPKPKPDVVITTTLGYTKREDGEFLIDGNYKMSILHHERKNIKFTFDGETGELKSAEVIK